MRLSRYTGDLSLAIWGLRSSDVQKSLAQPVVGESDGAAGGSGVRQGVEHHEAAGGSGVRQGVEHHEVVNDPLEAHGGDGYGGAPCQVLCSRYLGDGNSSRACIAYRMLDVRHP